MKRKIFGVLLALAMVITLGLVAEPATPARADTQVTLYSTPALDGLVNYGGAVNTIEAIGAGHYNEDDPFRGFVSFDLSTIPPWAVIDSATLRLYQYFAYPDAYMHLGNVIVDHLDYGDTLDNGDYNLIALHTNIGTLSTNTTVEWKELDVTNYVRDDRDNLRSRSQYRLRFYPLETDSDGNPDRAFFESPENKGGTGNQPELIVTYSAPSEVWVATTGDDNNPGTEQYPFQTIYRGIEVVADGGVVHVAAGTYTEDVYILSKSVSLRGANYGVNPNTMARGAESVIAGQVYIGLVNGASVLIDGFTVQPGEQNGIVLFLQDLSSLTIRNNIIRDIVSETSYDAIYNSTVDHSSLYISDNKINSCPDGITLGVGNGSSVVISGNHISGLTHGDSNGIYLSYLSGSSAIISANQLSELAGRGIEVLNVSNSTITISANQLSDIDFDGMLFGSILNTPVTISGNTLSLIDRVGIYFSSNVSDSSTVNVINNQLSNIGWQGIWVQSVWDSTAHINQNQLSNISQEAISVSDISNSTVTINQNQVSNANHYGIYVYNLTNSTLITENNTIHDISGSDSYGAYIGTAQYTGISIEGNEVYNCLRGIYAYQLCNSVFVTIGDNNIHDNGEGVYLYRVDTSSSVAISGNNITNNISGGSGIHLGEQVQASQVTVHYNNIVGNQTYGIRNRGPGGLDARFNWWGDSSGPTPTTGVPVPVDYGDKISFGVEYQPWLIDEWTGQTATPGLEITTLSPLPDGGVSEPYSCELEASGGSGSYSWSGYYSLPINGLSISADGVISGTPLMSGTYSFAVQVHDEYQGIWKEFQVTINPTPLSIVTTSLPDGQVGVPYSATLEASGGTGFYTWSIVVAGSLPPGLTLDSDTGQISGTPGNDGTYNFTVRVNSASQQAEKELSITVLPPLQITTTSLPDGVVGVAYSATLEASGGTGSYTWSIVAGSLPPGLTLNSDTGQISGTPGNDGTYNFTVRVNSGSLQAEKDLSINVSSKIKVTSPNGGEFWAVGETKTITWTSVGITGYVKIMLSRDGGSTWTTILTSTPNDGNQTWKVTAPQTTQARIKVASVSTPAVFDISDNNFNIIQPPPAPVLKSPASGSTVPNLTPRLEWNPSTGAVDYELQVATNSTFTNLVVDQTGITDLFYDIPGGTLNWNTTYYWRVRANDIYGLHSAWSTARYFKTAIGPPPNAPSDLTATPVSSTRINLSWQDNSNDETGFKIERKKGATGTWAQIATVGANVTSYSNTSGLTPSTQYFYRVRAYKATLNSAYSNEADATTFPPPPPVPTLKSPATGAILTYLTPRLEWNPSTGAADYGLQVATNSTFTNLVVDQTGITDLFYDIPDGILSWNTIYYWRVNARGSSGSTSNWSTYRTFKIPPAAPSDLTATAVSSTRIDLTWKDNSTGETGFKIERKKGATGTWAQIATVGANVTSYSNTGLTANTEYYYRVRAYSAIGNSDYSNEANATTG